MLDVDVFSQNTLTIGQVYDYEVGDEFHYSTSEIPPNATRYTILDKQYSALGDTVFYVLHYDNYYSAVNWQPEPHLEYFFNSFDHTVHYTNLNSLIGDQFNNIPIDTSMGEWFTDTTFVSTDWCDRLVYRYQLCLACSFEPNTYDEQFGAGVGLIFSIHTDLSSSQNAYPYRLMYYRKDELSCGTPDLTTVNISESVDLDNGFSIYPNPVSSVFALRNNQAHRNFQCSLFDSMGQTIRTMSLSGSVNIIDMSDFGSGIYYLRLNDGIRITTQRIVVTKGSH